MSRSAVHVDRAAHRAQVGHGGGGVDLHAGDPGGQAGVDHHGRHRRRLADDGHAVVDGAAAVAHQQLGHPVGSGRRQRRVDTALPALRALGRQLVPLLGAEDAHRREVRGLDHDGGRGVVELGARAAHDTGQTDRAGVVGDQQVLGREGASVAVERGQGLPCARPADHDRPLQPVAVVAVDRVAQLEHHVVRDVDGERDRAHPGQLHAPCQPARAGRGRVEAGHGAGHEHRAAVGGLHPHRVAGAVRLGGLPLRGVGVRRAVRQRRLARDPPQRQRVGTVGVDLELDHVVAQVEVAEGVVARLPRVGRQHDDPAWSSPRPSSFAEQIMPAETWP